MSGRASIASTLAALALACPSVTPEPAAVAHIEPPRVEADGVAAAALVEPAPTRLARVDAPSEPHDASPSMSTSGAAPSPTSGAAPSMSTSGAAPSMSTSGAAPSMSTINDASADPDARSADADADACDRRCEGGDQPGDDLLTLVDRSHGLLPTWEPDDLVALDPPYVIAEGSPPNLVRKAAADAFVALSDAALAATGVRINIRSGYRPFALQCGIFRAEVARTGCVEATRSSARAGFSEHQLGTTIDIALGWRRLDGAAPIDEFLRAHAHEFGWVLSYPEGAEEITGYKHEPWHFRYLGEAAARGQIAATTGDRRITTEEYLRAREGARTLSAR